MLRKIRKIFMVAFTKKGFFWKTTFLKAFGISDKTRWSHPTSLSDSWDERTALLAAHVPANSRVFEFGAARLSLRDMLPPDCTYLHSDIVARANDTYVLDLNEQLPDIPKVDVVVFSGVLEYLIRVPELLRHLSQTTDVMLFSYATTNAYPDISVRRSHGWVSDLSLESLVDLAAVYSFESEVIGEWRRQYLFKWQRINANLQGSTSLM